MATVNIRGASWGFNIVMGFIQTSENFCAASLENSIGACDSIMIACDSGTKLMESTKGATRLKSPIVTVGWTKWPSSNKSSRNLLLLVPIRPVVIVSVIILDVSSIACTIGAVSSINETAAVNFATSLPMTSVLDRVTVYFCLPYGLIIDLEGSTRNGLSFAKSSQNWILAFTLRPVGSTETENFIGPLALEAILRTSHRTFPFLDPLFFR
mmetsp:Transcript_4626/g.6312  ORF Transcript_4626/g.6312 Transcript_4626/m.6312 type:complete len:211 (+) Transcript_4626:1729-2361(+)